MPIIIIVGVILVNLALLFYTLFIINENKKQKATQMALTFITVAVMLDISATACMMAGTKSTFFTFHGMIGYAGLLLMIIDAVLLWKHKIKYGTEVLLSKGLNIYSKIAFLWWVSAFVTGVIITFKKV